jgi:predicted ATP-grasp superfamily ATP-dependent carboligase
MENCDHIVVLGSTLTALAIIRAARTLGLNCTLVDTRRGIAFDSRHQTPIFCPSATEEVLLQQLKNVASKAKTALIAENDAWLRFIVRHRPALQSMFASILHPNSRSIELCLDKSQFLDWCKDNGFTAPRHYEFEGVTRLIPSEEAPLLLRPETTRHDLGKSIPKAIEVKSRAELDRWLAHYAAAGVLPSVAESLLRPNIRQYSVGLAREFGGRIRSMVGEKLRSYPEQCAGGTYVILSAQDDVLSLAVRAIEALDYFGIAEVEILRDHRTGECFLIEINARPWVQLGLAQKAGLDFLGFVLGRADTQVGMAVTPRPLRWLNFEADVYGCLSRDTGAVWRGRLTLGDYLRSVFAANVFAIWDATDPQPFFRSAWHMLRRRVTR